MQVILGIIAVFIVLSLGYFALGLMGQLFIVALDTLARGFGVDSPVLGWIFVGVVFGAVAGLRYGLRRAGAPVSRARSALLIAIPLILLGSIGATRSSYHSSPSPAASQYGATPFTPIQPVADDRGAVAISTDAMNLRSEPTTRSSVVTTLHATDVLTPLGTAGEWTHVADRSSSSPRYTGWVKSKYLRRISDGADAADPSATKTSQAVAASVLNTQDGRIADPVDQAITDTAVARRNCYHAEGISCTVVPEQEQQPIHEAFTSSLDAINQRDIATAEASILRANQLLAPWLQRSPDDPWVARTNRHLNTIAGDIRTVCASVGRKGEQLAGC